ncbi:hypothetical protein [Bacteroides reticulotermitis]|uniref:Uncharacterized protein n=2 Tax=Bacteroides reticulotermitis TaxID=1133319 RepID=W4UR90_9BACE|nr:hypothetical protein [Bacteroides reticulotermitis]MBB4043794.1 hypothetical protein [Bacteroides reticulotermitis]GAE83317.1 hypothetical protein JCM10512_1581 [Bacteroides reticulotermitis JCM 10512]
MKAYRYNAKAREDRQFNNTGVEKNPNGLKYYASNMKYVEAYKYIRFEDGDINYECDLEVVELSNAINLFDMTSNFRMLNTYSAYVNAQIGAQLADYKSFLASAKTKKEIALWNKEIEALNDREEELIKALISNEFQQLSDFNFQNVLVSELKAQGFEGYYTVNEIVLF